MMLQGEMRININALRDRLCSAGKWRIPCNTRCIVLVVTSCLACLPLVPFGVSAQEWRFYGGDAGGTRVSSLQQINCGHVWRVKVAWTVDICECSCGRNEDNQLEHG